MSNFTNDIEQEHILTKIIHDIVFKNYLDKQYGCSSTLIDFDTNLHNQDKQFEGVDIEWTFSDGRTMNVDVKCQTNQYINHPTPTFCIELSYFKGNDLKEGWFIQQTNKTNYYLFVWINKANLTNNDIIKEKDQLEEFEFMLVNKKEVRQMLYKNGLTNEDLKRISFYMRDNNIKRYDEKFARFVCSTHLSEKPINIVIPKNTYLTLKNTRYYVYKHETITKIK